MRPNQKAQKGDSNAGKRDERVAKDVFPSKTRNDLADDAHGGQDHDIDNGMRVEPEQVLEQERIATQGRVEDADAHDPFGDH